MSRRVVVLLAAVTALILLVVAGILGSRAYVELSAELASPSATPISAEVTEQLRDEYLAAIDLWPYPLPAEDALPERPPVEFATYGGEIMGFVSVFYRCAWEAAHLTGSGESHERALDMLGAWEQLPEGTSFFSDMDGTYRTEVLGTARAGDDTVMAGIFENSCSDYHDNRVDPPAGITIDKPIPPPAAEGCTDLPPDVPCDPAVGPDRVVDTGATEFAMGETVLDSRGTPIAYIVAAGDSWTVVAERFLMGSKLWSLNCYYFEWSELYVGDVVNLSMYRVATVGVNNGRSEPATGAQSCLQQTGLPPQL